MQPSSGPYRITLWHWVQEVVLENADPLSTVTVGNKLTFVSQAGLSSKLYLPGILQNMAALELGEIIVFLVPDGDEREVRQEGKKREARAGV